MLLMGVCAIAVRLGIEHDRYSDECLTQAVEAVWRDNPNARKLIDHYGSGDQIIVSETEGLSLESARLAARSKRIRVLRFRAPMRVFAWHGRKQMLEPGRLEVPTEVVALLASEFPVMKVTESTIECRRDPRPLPQPEGQFKDGEWLGGAGAVRRYVPVP